MNKERNMTLGLDLGIASIGWCLYEDDQDNNPYRIIDIGSFVYDQIEDKDGKTQNITRREKRGMRRQRRRKALRLEDLRKLLKRELSMDFFSVIENKSIKENPFEIKVKGLNEKLSKEELSIALYHYMKWRGFKSNRKAVDGDASKNKNDGKLLKNINKVKGELANNDSGSKTYISQYLVNKYNQAEVINKRFHNNSDDYYLTVSRDMYLDEINVLLDKQIEFDVISKSFKEEYLKLYMRQRDFSDGPDAQSPYHMSIDEMIGICEIDELKRAPKDSVSAKRFVLLSSIVNLRFRLTDDAKYNEQFIIKAERAGYYKLSPKAIQNIENEVFKSGVKAYTYKALFKSLTIEPLSVKGLSLSRKQYKDIVNKVKDANKKNAKDLSLEIENEQISLAAKEALLSKNIFKQSEYFLSLRKLLEKSNDYKKFIPQNHDIKDENEFYMNNDEIKFYDTVASIMIRSKTDQRIQEECEKAGFPQPIIEIIKSSGECKDTINLSIEACNYIIPLLRKGTDYKNARDMYENWLNKDSRKKAVKTQKLPEINQALSGMGVTLRNPVVKHTLVQMRKIINAIIDEYGLPNHYSVELTRDLKKSFKERREIRGEQLDNQEGNIREKIEILQKYKEQFSSLANVSRDDLIKYKLFNQQGGFSPYTGARINEGDLFKNGYYEVDHILPYSRSFDDSFSNKVLVEAKENQDKKNRTPVEWAKIHPEKLERIKEFIASHHQIPLAKQNKLLATEISDDFITKDFNDTSYLSNLAKDLIEFYLLDEGKRCQTVSGAITEKLRRLWGVSGRTHSFISSYSKDYKVKFLEQYKFKEMKLEDNKKLTITFKNNEGDFQIVLEPKKKNGAKELSKRDQYHNRELQIFIENNLFFSGKFNACEGKDIDTLFSCIDYVGINTNDGERREAGMYVLGVAFNAIQNDINAKNRDNDLHHALDAAVIGLVNPKIVRRFSEFNKKIEFNYDEKLDDNIDIEPPYKNFKKEVLLRVYEKDISILKQHLSELDTYNPEILKNVHVMWPTRLPNKDVVGAISNETIFGVRKDGMLEKRISVSKLTYKNIENIVDKDKGSKAVYEACKLWLKAKDNEKNKYPFLENKGVYIKSVKVYVGSSPKDKVDLSNGRFADNSTVVRVEVYKKNGDPNTIYMVPIYYYQIFKEQSLRKSHKSTDSIMYTIMWKQGDDGKTILSSKELTNNYKKIAVLPTRSVVEIEKTDGTRGFAYTGGCTGGQMEFYSLLGDGQDLKDAKLFSNTQDRYKITISTIKNIKVHSITPLGRIY